MWPTSAATSELRHTYCMFANCIAEESKGRREEERGDEQRHSDGEGKVYDLPPGLD